MRYSHSAVSLLNKEGEASLYITHGYYYSLRTGKAIWLKDTWRYQYDKNEWEEVVTTVSPSARYGALAVAYQGDIYLHGGDDGSHISSSSYQPKYFSDFWRFCPVHNQWTLLSGMCMYTCVCMCVFNVGYEYLFVF